MHYTGTIWRPPYEASSLLLEVTAGCTHHKCKFCTLYHGLPFPFKLTPLDVIEQDLQEAQLRLTDPMALLSARLQGLPRVDAPQRVFLTGANPFVLNFERLTAISALIHQYLPAVNSIGCFARITDITAKTDAELAALRATGYDGLTIGMETGDDDALRFMEKGYAAFDVQKQCCRLDRAGIRYSLFYLAGISGAGRGEAGAQATATLCNQLRPTLIGVNMLTVCPEAPLYQEIQDGRWQESSELEKYHEIRTLVEHLNISTRFAALGASNAFQFQGVLPRDKKALLAELDSIIKTAGEADLREYRVRLKHL
ncbi:MAG: radical SAM protein [Oscillospiraceae bacterium]|nr:radical SAM protein [Oscillospiraceae bacterium]